MGIVRYLKGNIIHTIAVCTTMYERKIIGILTINANIGIIPK